MNKILNAIKCVNCQSVLSSPVFLPCTHSVCQKHEIHSNDGFVSVYCFECGIEHRKSSNGVGFPANSALATIIEAQIESLEFGKGYKEAKESCEKLRALVKHAEELLNDPENFTFEKLDEMKNAVQLRGEEIKLRIDSEMLKLIEKMNEHRTSCKDYLRSDEYGVVSSEFVEITKLIRDEINQSELVLNELKTNEVERGKVRRGNERKFGKFEETINAFKERLLLEDFKKKKLEVNHFMAINIDDVLQFDE